MTQRAPLATWLAFVALAICPIACLGEAVCHSIDAAGPHEGGREAPCEAHSCLCAGAPAPAVTHAAPVAAERPHAVAPAAVFDPAPVASAVLHAAPPQRLADPPPERGVPPLLI